MGRPRIDPRVKERHIRMSILRTIEANRPWHFKWPDGSALCKKPDPTVWHWGATPGVELQGTENPRYVTCERGMRYASVCSGVEAASLAWMPIGWNAAWFSEIEPFPRAVLKYRFPDVPNLGDMTKIKVENMENGDQKFTGADGTVVVVPGGVDLLVGGTPCQSFSVAGKREGMGGASGLAEHFVRLLGEMRPRWFVWENVPGALSSRTSGQRDFNFLVNEYAKCGYACAWRVLDAQYVRVDGYTRAVPQRRRRVFVVGHLGAEWEYPASVLFEPDCLFRNSPPRRIKGKGFAGDTAYRPREAGGRPWDASGVNPTLNQCNAGSGIIGCIQSGTLRTELQRTGDDRGRQGILCPIGTGADFGSPRRPAPPQHRMHGRFVHGRSRKRGGRTWIFGRNCADNKGIAQRIEPSPGNYLHPRVAGPHLQYGHANAVNRNNGLENCVCYGIGNGQAHEASKPEAEVSKSLHCMHDQEAILCVTEAISQYGKIAGTIEARHDSSPCADRGQNIVFCYENHAQDSRIKDTGDVSPQLNAKAGTGGGNLPLVQTFTKTAHPQNSEQGQGFAETDTAKTLSVHTSPASEIRAEELVAVAIAGNTIGRKPHNATVRRLLPIETERLMGFPDNWTRIPWKGKPAEECPDSPRYKACGNSMCVNVMRWIGMRIELTERKVAK